MREGSAVDVVCRREEEGRCTTRRQAAGRRKLQGQGWQAAGLSIPQLKQPGDAPDAPSIRRYEGGYQERGFWLEGSGFFTNQDDDQATATGPSSFIFPATWQNKGKETSICRCSSMVKCTIEDQDDVC